jgi:hypothetical protein
MTRRNSVNWQADESGPIFSQIAWDRDFGPVRIANLARYIEEMQKK